jgi:hypothetical protein
MVIPTTPIWPPTITTLTYDNEMLDAHYVSRFVAATSIIALTAVHSVFHLSTNCLSRRKQAGPSPETAATGDATFLNEYVIDVTEVPADLSTLLWDGNACSRRLSFVTEMQYQHLRVRGIRPSHSAQRRSLRVRSTRRTWTRRSSRNCLTVLPLRATKDRHGRHASTTIPLSASGWRTGCTLIEFLKSRADVVRRPVPTKRLVSNIKSGGAVEVSAMTDEFQVPALQSNLLACHSILCDNIARGRETASSP